MMKTVAAAVAMNVNVATIDRFDNRLTPQMPCPLVQPPPSCDPKPTSRPDRGPDGRTGGRLDGFGEKAPDNHAGRHHPEDEEKAPLELAGPWAKRARENAAHGRGSAVEREKGRGGGPDEEPSDNR
jgi:hypothetical protein